MGLLQANEVSTEPWRASSWPQVTLVTPVRNSAAYIEQTIRSVLGQGYMNLEYFIVDGGSTNGTVETIRKYEKNLAGWISEPDRGMYDALNKDFAHSTGEMGWISATDLLHVVGLAVNGTAFRDLPRSNGLLGTLQFSVPREWRFG
jgi:cellulose synthase/poly-beta-1,6-N-acetylglucosamine synthase-like glycosyltransferase